MAQKTITQLLDDLEAHNGREGVEATQTVQFRWNNSDREIDLNDANASQLASLIQPFYDASRPATGSRRRSSGASAGAGASKPASSAGSNREQNKLIREFWASEYERDPNTPLGAPTERGRIPKEVTAAYEQRGNGSAPAPAPSGATQPSDPGPSPVDQEAPASQVGGPESSVNTEGWTFDEGEWHDAEGFVVSDRDLENAGLSNA